MAQEACTCDGHQGIPRDAKGVPIYLILPDDIRALYERRMAAFEKAWVQTRDPRVYKEAATWAWSHRQPMPTWLHEAIIKGGSEPTPQQAENARRRYVHHQRYRAVMAALYDTVRAEDGRLKFVARLNSKGRPVSDQKAYEAAAEICGCEWPMVERSFKLVKADLERGFWGRYHIMPDPDATAVARRTVHQLKTGTPTR